MLKAKRRSQWEEVLQLSSHMTDLLQGGGATRCPAIREKKEEEEGGGSESRLIIAQNMTKKINVWYEEEWRLDAVLKFTFLSRSEII